VLILFHSYDLVGIDGRNMIRLIVYILAALAG
jgi:hypothetical protein